MHGRQKSKLSVDRITITADRRISDIYPLASGRFLTEHGIGADDHNVEFKIWDLSQPAGQQCIKVKNMGENTPEATFAEHRKKALALSAEGPFLSEEKDRIVSLSPPKALYYRRMVNDPLPQYEYSIKTACSLGTNQFACVADFNFGNPNQIAIYTFNEDKPWQRRIIDAYPIKTSILSISSLSADIFFVCVKHKNLQPSIDCWHRSKTDDFVLHTSTKIPLAKKAQSIAIHALSDQELLIHSPNEKGLISSIKKINITDPNKMFNTIDSAKGELFLFERILSVPGCPGIYVLSACRHQHNESKDYFTSYVFNTHTMKRNQLNLQDHEEIRAVTNNLELLILHRYRGFRLMATPDVLQPYLAQKNREVSNILDSALSIPIDLTRIVQDYLHNDLAVQTSAHHASLFYPKKATTLSAPNTNKQASCSKCTIM
jgi:hypothetical protein